MFNGVAKRFVLATSMLLVAASVIRAAADTGDEHIVMGTPTDAGGDPVKNETDFLMRKDEYVLSYNNKTKIPNWVCWHLTNDWAAGKVDRANDFRPDPALPKEWVKVKPSNYSKTGFDKGHMCNSADRSDTKAHNSATFLMTNMVPQSPNNNRKGWEQLEEYCRSLLDTKDLYIACGPAGLSGGGVGGNGPAVSIKIDDKNKIIVPAQTWKVILVVPQGLTDPKKVVSHSRTIAVIMPNNQSVGEDWSQFRVPIADVEELTGYKFFSKITEVNKDVADELKSQTDDVRIQPLPRRKGKE